MKGRLTKTTQRQYNIHNFRGKNPSDLFRILFILPSSENETKDRAFTDINLPIIELKSLYLPISPLFLPTLTPLVFLFPLVMT